ncbi:MAG TPA: sigma-70 family RNA polymerase sigma factor [Phycisphaerae bacterium]|nr:sigma-70 family RNA polymerase sigma factor [Phycisphaerae bacterium]
MPTDVVDAEKLWKRYLKNRDVETRNTLVEHYSPLVRTQASRISRKLPAQVTYDEICSAGFDGLIEAVEAFNPDRKTKFETFCQQRVVGAVMDWLRSLDIQSRTVRRFEKKVVDVREMLDAELGRPPTNKEMSRRMGIAQERFEHLSRLSRMGHEIHLSSVGVAPGAAGHSDSRPWELNDARQADPSSRIARSMLADHVTRGLTREERLVVVLYYFEGLTMAEIGSVLNLSESRVSQIHKEVMMRLRRRFKDRIDELVA